MGLVIKDYNQMVEDTLQRILDADIGITNISPGSVVRTIVEAILPEIDVANYNVMQAYGSKTVDEAEGEDLDKIGELFGVVRDIPRSATGVVTFSTTEASDTDIYIQYNHTISTKPNSSGVIYDAIVTDENVYLPAGQLSVDVNISMVEPGVVYLPIGSLSVINTSMIGIDSVSNMSIISGGYDGETDEELRIRIKQALTTLGKGTAKALEDALKDIDGVVDAVVLDMKSGIGTSNAIVVTNPIPPTDILMNTINTVVASVKSAGIKINVIYPTITYVNTTVITTGGDIDTIGKAILQYIGTLSISDTYFVSQMERTVLNAINDASVDITTISPSDNVAVYGTHVIKSGTITINGVVYNA